jgi:group II intron reverse transcriptase/maturase
MSIAEFDLCADEKLLALHEALLSGRYRPGRLRRVPVSKSNGDKRWLSIPSVTDRIAQAAALIAIGPSVDAHMSETSCAYRPGRGTYDAIAAVHAAIGGGFRWIVDADIDKFFDTIEHRRLMEDVSIWLDDDRVIKLIARWLAGFGKRGVAQGAPISPLLANVFLHPLDRLIAAEGHKAVRYADDFLILSRSESSAKQALSLAQRLLACRGLRPNLNTTFRELVDLKKELAKFMPAWHYALGGRGAF